MQRKQKNQSGGWSQEVREELGDNAGVLSISTASERGRDVEDECTGGLLEKILDRGNLNLAFKRVKSNKGSHGADGMKVDELLTLQRTLSVREHWAFGGIMSLLLIPFTIWIYIFRDLAVNFKTIFPFILLFTILLGIWAEGREKRKKKYEQEIGKMKAHDINE